MWLNRYADNGQEMDTEIRVQMLDEDACILNSVITSGKRVYLSIPLRASGRLGSLTLLWEAVSEKEGSKCNPVKHTTRTEG